MYVGGDLQLLFFIFLREEQRSGFLNWQEFDFNKLRNMGCVFLLPR